MINKYYKQQLYKSTDGGLNWTAMDVYQEGGIIELEGDDCSPKFRTVSGTPYCNGSNLCAEVIREVSYDGGDTWETASTKIEIIEKNSPYCGFADYLTFVAEESGTFKFTKDVYYSVNDGVTWNLLTANTDSPTINVGEKIIWKGTITPTFSDGVGTFSSSGKFRVEGTPMSLLYGDSYIDERSLVGKEGAFTKLFSGCTNLTSAERLILPATTLSTQCYDSMFIGCTSLTTAPRLMATTLGYGCYGWMFYGCTSLTTAPELPAETLEEQCYYSMFENCRSLTTTPNLRATILPRSCYANMFRSCLGLTSVSEFSATTIGKWACNQMFKGCINLITPSSSIGT